MPAVRIYGAVTIMAGLAVIGGEALMAIGAHGLLGDFAFATAGVMFAIFATLLRRWRLDPLRATAVISVLTLLYIPIQAVAFGFGRMIAAGFAENALQAVAQGIFSGPARDLSVRPLRGAARRVAGGGVSLAGAGFHHADRICRAGGAADARAGRWLRPRAVRVSAYAEGIGPFAAAQPRRTQSCRELKDW